MSSSSLTNRPTLKGKWVFFAAAVLIFCSAFFTFSNILVSFVLDLNDLEIVDFDCFLSPLFEDSIGAFVGIIFSLLYISFDYMVPYFLVIVFPILMLMLYILCGHQLRIGSLLMSLAILAAPSYYVSDVLETLMNDWYYAIMENADFSWGTLASALLIVLAVGLCILAALVFPLISKAGKWVAALTFGLGMLLAYASYVCVYIDPAMYMLEYGELHSSTLFGFLMPSTTIQLTALLMFFVMLFSKGMPLFQKKAVALTEEETVQDAAPVVEETETVTEDLSDTDTDAAPAESE